MDRLDQILAGVNMMSSSFQYQGQLNNCMITTRTEPFPDISPRTLDSPGTHESFRPTQSSGASNEGSRDYLKIMSCKTTADAVLTWPIFGGSFPQDALIGIIFNPQDMDGNSSSSGSHDTHQVPGGLQSLPDERIPILVDRFLECVHTKNPILDVDSLLRHGRRAAENGLGWDAHSCLILLACALGCVAYPFDPQKGGSREGTAEGGSGPSSSTLFSRELQLAESCYVLACRRLGILNHTVLGAQCHFFAGGKLKYSFYADQLLTPYSVSHVYISPTAGMEPLLPGFHVLSNSLKDGRWARSCGIDQQPSKRYEYHSAEIRAEPLLVLLQIRMRNPCRPASPAVVNR